MMVKYDVNRLPVIENGKLVGIVARSDIIKGLSESAE
jgi:CBS domain-containing protein